MMINIINIYTNFFYKRRLKNIGIPIIEAVIKFEGDASFMDIGLYIGNKHNKIMGLYPLISELDWLLEKRLIYRKKVIVATEYGFFKSWRFGATRAGKKLINKRIN